MKRKAYTDVYHSTDTKPGLGQISGYYPGTYAFLSKDHAIAYDKAHVFQTNIDSSKLFELSYRNADELKEEAKRHGFGYSPASGYPEAEYLKTLGFIGIKRGKEVILFNNQKWDLMQNENFSPKPLTIEMG